MEKNAKIVHYAQIVVFFCKELDNICNELNINCVLFPVEQ